MSHITIADDGTLTLAEGSTLDDLALPELPTLVETVIEEQKLDAPVPPSQEQVDAIEEEARVLTKLKKDTEERLNELKAVMRRIGKNEAGLTFASNLSTPSVIDDSIVEEKYPYNAVATEDVVVTGPRGGKKVETRVVFPNQHLYKITVNKDAVKKHLGPDELAEVKVDGTTRVTFK